MGFSWLFLLVFANMLNQKPGSVDKNLVLREKVPKNQVLSLQPAFFKVLDALGNLCISALSRDLHQLLGAHLPTPAPHHADALLALQLGAQVHQVVDVRVQQLVVAVLGAPKWLPEAATKGLATQTLAEVPRGGPALHPAPGQAHEGF